MSTIYPAALTQLTGTRGSMVAASLEIDGRADVAVDAVFFQSELIYRDNLPYSEAAIARESLLEDLQVFISRHGVDAAIDYMRPAR